MEEIRIKSLDQPKVSLAEPTPQEKRTYGKVIVKEDSRFPKSNTIRNIILTGVAAVSLCASGIFYTISRPENNETYKTPSQEIGLTKIVWQRPQLPIPDRNPFVFTSGSDERKFNLKGIVDVEGKKSALINGKSYYEGDKAFGYIITEINRDYVKVMDPNTKEVLEKRVGESPPSD